MLKLNFRTASRFRTTKCLAALIILVATSLFCSPSASAYNKGANSTTDKIVAKALETCYNGLQNTIKLLDAQDFLKHRDNSVYKNKIFSDTSLSVPVPNINFGVEGTAQSNPRISCVDFLFGSSNWAGIANATFNSEASLSDAKAFLEKLQYTATAPGSGSGNTDRVCLSVSRTIIDPDDGSTDTSTTNKICADVQEENGVAYVDGALFTDWTPIRDIWMRVDGTGHEIEFGDNSGAGWLVGQVSTCAGRSNTCKWDDIVSAVQSEISLAYDGNSFVKVVVNADTPDFSGGNSGGNTALSDSDVYNKGTTNSVISALTGESGSLALSNAEIYSYYVKYLSNGKYITVSCEDGFNYSDPWKNIPKIKYGGEITNKCYYLEKDRIKYTIADADKLMVASANIESVISALNSMDLAAIKDDIADLTPNASPSDLTDDDPTSPGTPTTGTDIPQTEATCHSTSGAMGWFICPVLEFAASASAWIYEYVIEPSLVIRSELFRTDNSGGKGTFEAWGVFRDIANIIFAVLLLFVIFSQITGIGIDNYGIKKTLPNLIVAAILVNLSYIICQALVDVSNIAGGGLYGLISRITVNVPNTDVAGIGFSTSIIFTIAVAVGGLTATGIAVGGLGAFWSLVGGALLAVLPALIGALVAVVFLFFMLAMRQTMVVLLVVVSPLAFVCYTLPNTKNLFNRWAQLMRGMLLLYPICALMIAGGRLASKIILASGAAENNLFIILVAMVAEAGPLFLIPGLTRSAYRATGQLGATLNGFRGRLAGGARHMIAGNPAFRRTIDRNRFERIGNRNNRILSRYEESAKNLASGTGGLRDRFRARQTTGNLERITEARKMQVAAEQRQQEIAKWAGTATTDSTGREIRDVSGNLITQGQAIVNAQIANAQLNTEGEVARANLMNNVQYQDTRRTQTAKTISEETTKMYADSYSRMSVTQLQTALAGAVNAVPGSANQSEQISAAIRTFSSIGQMDKARDVLNANSAGMQAYATSNAENRNRLVQELGGSGDWIMREYSKHIAKQAEIPGGVVKDFSSWSNSADAAADSSLAASLRKRGVSALADLDKDSIEYVTNNANALNAVSADAFASAAANTTNGEIITKLSNAIERLDDAKRQTIVNNTSADQFVRMSDDIRSTLALGHRSAPGHRTDGRIRVVFNAQINDLRQPANSQIAARLSSQDRARFGV